MGYIGKNLKYLDVRPNAEIYRDQRDQLPEVTESETEDRSQQ